MAKETFINKPEDIQWLKDTHLKGLELPTFKSFVLHGNEDCPEKIDLHAAKMPNYDADPAAVYYLQDDQSYKLPQDAIWYHGTEETGFPAFDWRHIGKKLGVRSPGFWFHNKRDGAAYFGPNIVEVRLTYCRPMNVSREDFIDYGWGPSHWAKQANDEGFDAVIIRNITDGGTFGDVACVFRPTQITIVEFHKAETEDGG